jgi:hypothetical protein
MTDHAPTPAQSIWQNQPVEGIQMSVDEIRKRAGRFERKIFWRNVREYLSSLIAMVLFANFYTRTHEVLIRVAYVLFIAGLAWVIIQLHRKGSSKSVPAQLGILASLQYFRAEMERQRETVQNVWSWYLAPLVPGFVVLSAGYVSSMPFPKGLLAAGILDALVAALFFGVWRMNVRAAKCLQHKIDELHAMEDSHPVRQF